MIFTTIAETHSELGKEKVVLVLMGSNTQAMTPELKRVSTYGKGKSYGTYAKFELTEKADGLLAGTLNERVVFDVAITQQ